MKIYLFFISCFSCLSAMEEIPSVVTESVIMTVTPRRRFTWTAQLDNGQTVNASSCYRRHPRNACKEDRFKVRYMGYIGRKRMNEDEAERWVKKLIKASISVSNAKKG